MSLASRVKDRLAELDMSYEEAARKCGKSTAAVWKVATGKTENPGFLAELADALDVPIAWLRKGGAERRQIEAKAHPDTEASEFSDDSLILDLLNRYDRMSTPQKGDARFLLEKRFQIEDAKNNSAKKNR